ncbi:hypothetical protein ACIGZJ_31080 [Kitasatospora sp. NPDC052868]|uniref:hypothetical protein n=1 Tax=Kitasatospora sp. NPDC052868 TaxID=3364060 RepID=UPI0037C659DA
MASKKLTAALVRDDRREDAGMHADDRSTCHTHQSWAPDCAPRHGAVTADSLLAEQRAVEQARARRAQT